MSAPGWYPDPQDARRMRWWDGSAWTGHVADPAARPPPAPTGSPASTAPAEPASPTPGWSALGAPTATAPFGAPPSPPPSSSGSNRGWIIGAVVAVVVVVVLLVLPFVIYRSVDGTASPSTVPRSPTTTGDGSRSGQQSELEEAAGRAGIPVLDEEGTVTHTHTLLHVLVDDEEIVIPSGIGIDRRRIAAVHTHEPYGVLHVESPHHDDVYTLGQFLVLWGAGEDDDALCETFVGGPCTVEIEVVAPSRADLVDFESFGPMPDEPPIGADGLDTELAQGAVIELRVTSA